MNAAMIDPSNFPFDPNNAEMPTNIVSIASPDLPPWKPVKKTTLKGSERLFASAEDAARQLIRSWCDYGGPKTINEIDPKMMPGIHAEIASVVIDVMLNEGARDFAGVCAYFVGAPEGLRTEFIECNDANSPHPKDCGPLIEAIRNYYFERQREIVSQNISKALESGDDPSKFLEDLKNLEKEKSTPTDVTDGILTTSEIMATNIEDDENSLIAPKTRFLGKSGSFVIVGPSGIGKSTLTTSFILHAATGRTWHGIEFRRPLKTLVVQAENDEGDLKEMLGGAILAAGMANQKGTLMTAVDNIKWKRLSTKTGADFCRWLEAAIIATGSELILVDPILAYVGDDISQQKAASHFFRELLQPVLNRTGAMIVIVHHTGKTSTDSKSRQNWSESDYAYLGLGSSELTNWARANAVFVPFGTDTGKFKFLITKRASRAGMINAFTHERTTSILLEHAGQGLGWVQAQPPEEDDEEEHKGAGRKPKVTPSDILKELGTASTATRKDVLVETLKTRFRASERAVREKIDGLLLGGKIIVAETTPRPGGGKPVEWLQINPSKPEKQ